LFLKEKNNFLEEQCTFFNETYVPNLFAITTISCLFLYRLATYHWKVWRKATTLKLKVFQLKFVCKIYDQIKFQTHLFSGNIVVPSCNLSPWSLGDMVGLGGKTCINYPGK
jgi:hypothetical protein